MAELTDEDIQATIDHLKDLRQRCVSWLNYRKAGGTLHGNYGDLAHFREEVRLFDHDIRVLHDIQKQVES